MSSFPDDGRAALNSPTPFIILNNLIHSMMILQSENEDEIDRLDVNIRAFSAEWELCEFCTIANNSEKHGC